VLLKRLVFISFLHSCFDFTQERFIREEDLHQWFETLRPLLDERKYHPALVFNMDETFVHTEGGKPEAVLASRTGPRPVVIDSPKAREHITLALVCIFFSCIDTIQTISASGDLVSPSLIIVPLKEAPPITHELTQEFFALSGQPSGCHY